MGFPRVSFVGHESKSRRYECRSRTACSSSIRRGTAGHHVHSSRSIQHGLSPAQRKRISLHLVCDHIFSLFSHSVYLFSDGADCERNRGGSSSIHGFPTATDVDPNGRCAVDAFADAAAYAGAGADGLDASSDRRPSIHANPNNTHRRFQDVSAQPKFYR